jgi:hypothetical protein
MEGASLMVRADKSISSNTNHMVHANGSLAGKSGCLTMPGRGIDAPRSPDESSPLPASNSPLVGRQANGKFAKGNPGGPGNPHARETARILQLMKSEVSDEDILDLTRKLVERGKEGDVGAIKVIFAYKIGKPQPAPLPDWIEHEGWENIKKAVVHQNELKRVLDAPQAALINTMCGILLPAIEERERENFLHTQLEPDLPKERKAVAARARANRNEEKKGNNEESVPMVTEPNGNNARAAGSASDRKNEVSTRNGKPMQTEVDGKKPTGRRARAVAKILTERLRSRL